MSAPAGWQNGVDRTTGFHYAQRRPIRIFPFDPMTDRFRDPVISQVPFEFASLGPVGRLVEVVDFDLSTEQWLPRLDLNAPDVLINQGLAPSEGDFRFHQQMTYAVAMRVLEVFERGLGRPLIWTERLRLLPHAFGQPQSYFDPSRFAVLFGYFDAHKSHPGENLSGQRIFTCLSYDVVAHETSHPVMWQLRPSDRVDDSRTSDAAALAEGMADLVAILVRFTEPDVFAQTIRSCGATLIGTPLLRIAMQFGAAMDRDTALREFPQPARREAGQTETEVHARGMLLTSAVIEALTGAYDEQIADLLRLNGGPPEKGNVHPDLVRALSVEAASLASKVTRSAIAALDYLPALKPTFYDFLRAILATDTMLFGAANHRFRALLIKSFHARGLIPGTAGSLAAETLVLSPTDQQSSLRLPHASDVLLHTVSAAECRRQYMTRPSRLSDALKKLKDQESHLRTQWMPAIAEFAQQNATKLRLDRGRSVQAMSLTGSNQFDSGGNLVSRVFVTLVQNDGGARPRGVQLVCDSDGAVQFILGSRARRHTRPTTPTASAAEKKFVSALSKAGFPGSASAKTVPWAPHRTDRRTWRRGLRILPFDPMVDRVGRSVIANVMYEKVEPGPTGRLIQVIDYDPVHGCYYEPLDLDDSSVLLDCGLEVAEDDPRFHQQMVYAVAMRVLETFERALGRPFRWRANRRLRIYPHAFVGQNAGFDEDMFALLFGYFAASADDPGPNLPNQVVFTALSHDIIAHETTHAVLKRLRPQYSMPTNPDVLAFHEGFADLVAILQHFTYPEIVAEHIASSRGDLTDRAVSETNPLLSLAMQFEYSRGGGAPMRTALMQPDKKAYLDSEGEHERGAVLVAAVIDGFLRSFSDAVAGVIRIATAGSGVLQPGALHPDLVQRIAVTASRTAERITTMCVRAFDYLPPVDITFSDYLRALVTADLNLFPDDTVHLRANLIEGFRTRGIFPTGVVSLAERSLRIAPAQSDQFAPLPLARDRLLDTAREFDRRRRTKLELFADEEPETAPDDAMLGPQPEEWARPEDQHKWAQQLHAWAMKHRAKLGLAPVRSNTPLAVDGFHTSQYLDADGYLQSQMTVQFVQRQRGDWDELGGIVPLGGVTVVADGEGHVRYVISKALPAAETRRLGELRNFVSALENRLPAAAWSPKPKQRIVDRLNLRSLDVHR